MNFLVSASTDKGIKKNTNQDSLAIKVAETTIGKITLALVCDGMGGLQQGEVASANLTLAFSNWFDNDLPQLLQHGIEDYKIYQEWNQIIQTENKKILLYGRQQGINLGTTIVAALFTNNRYYILNIGDSRVYEIKDSIRLLTQDQTVVENEFRKGLLTREQADNDSRRSVLLQCVGAIQNVVPEMLYGNIQKDAVYMLCSDGFRHVISTQELYEHLNPNVLISKEVMKQQSELLIELNKSRMEQDNITVSLIRTF
ncbi:MAG: serine/threonine-protein phosphatase [Lachnospiraceae bacterium]|nr:serine/threonine-protein phosphatase [Lachnospiraceae bacterium]